MFRLSAFQLEFSENRCELRPSIGKGSLRCLIARLSAGPKLACSLFDLGLVSLCCQDSISLLAFLALPPGSLHGWNVDAPYLKCWRYHLSYPSIDPSPRRDRLCPGHRPRRDCRRRN
jgi:hypothetical protein